jgi:hypothetical protein
MSSELEQVLKQIYEQPHLPNKAQLGTVLYLFNSLL